MCSAVLSVVERGGRTWTLARRSTFTAHTGAQCKTPFFDVCLFFMFFLLIDYCVIINRFYKFQMLRDRWVIRFRIIHRKKIGDCVYFTIFSNIFVIHVKRRFWRWQKKISFFSCNATRDYERMRVPILKGGSPLESELSERPLTSLRLVWSTYPPEIVFCIDQVKSQEYRRGTFFRVWMVSDIIVAPAKASAPGQTPAPQLRMMKKSLTQPRDVRLCTVGAALRLTASGWQLSDVSFGLSQALGVSLDKRWRTPLTNKQHGRRIAYCITAKSETWLRRKRPPDKRNALRTNIQLKTRGQKRNITWITGLKDTRILR